MFTKIQKSEYEARGKEVSKIMAEKGLDGLFVYFNEYYKENGRYLSNYWPQVESGAVIMSRTGKRVLVGGPEGQPYAREMSVISDIRNVPEFMVEGEEYPGAKIETLKEIFDEISEGTFKRVGVVGYTEMPASVYHRMEKDLAGKEIVNATADFEELRHVKSKTEIELLAKSAEIADKGMLALVAAVKEGEPEYKAAAAADFAMRDAGAEGFGWTTMVMSGERVTSVLGRATDRIFRKGEIVVASLSPLYQGYAGALSRMAVVGGKLSREQKEVFDILLGAYNKSIEKLGPGVMGKEVDLAARNYLDEYGFGKYMLYGGAHSIGLREFEQPFFGPNSDYIIQPGMVVAIDVHAFGHAKLPGIRFEEVFAITENGKRHLSSCPQIF